MHRKNTIAGRRPAACRARIRETICGAVIAAMIALGCTGAAGTDQCRSERDRSTLCGILALEYAVVCSRANAADPTSVEAQACFLPATGALVICPALVSSECSN